jgi:hypothetical protein
MIRLTRITSDGTTRTLLPDGAARQITSHGQSHSAGSSNGRLTAEDERIDQGWARSIERVFGEVSNGQPQR